MRESRPERFLDVRFADFQRDPMAVVRAVYQRFGLDLDPGTESRMQAWIAANPQHKHGRHEYDPQRFGLGEAMIHERFADYMRRHDLFER